MNSAGQKLSPVARADHVQTRILLLVEDNPADAEIVRDMLSSAGGEADYVVHHVSRLAAATDLLASSRVDVILLDLRLPDASGVDAVKAIQAITSDIPIVVLTGMADEAMALQCIDAGAQDYLAKDELKPLPLRRTIGYAVARLREMQLREMQALLHNYRAMSSAGVPTSVTANIAGVGSIRDRDKEGFARITDEYAVLLARYIEQLNYKDDKPKDIMGSITTALGDAGGGPRDLLDVHVAALERSLDGLSVERARATVIEGRLLALEMMGLLVDYYRTGSRSRVFSGGLR